MLSNLVSNAIKFTEKGSVRIEGREGIGADGRSVLAFSVIDTGIGIDPAQQAELFQPFSQVDRSSTRKFQGTGLGLSIIRSLAEQMGGKAGVSSTLGQGAHFWFEVLADPVAANEDSRQLERGLPIGTTDEDRRPRLILIVEDNPTNRRVIEAILRKQGMVVDCRENGALAVQAITEQGIRPDAILMDCQMPVMDGFQATREIRRWERANGLQPTRIIALTAAAYEEDRRLCLAAGMDDFLAKPIDVKAMLKALGTIRQA
jgi:hypothetical protein